MATKLAKIIADFRTSLATKILVGGTSGSLQAALDDDGIALPTGTYYFTIDGDNSQKEHIQATLTGTALTAIQSVSRQGVLTSGMVRQHRVGAIVILSDFAHILMMNNLLAGSDNFNAAIPLGYDGTASITTANQFATKAYVDGVAIAGAPDGSTTVKGIMKLSVAPVSGVNPIAVGDNDGRVPTQNENDAMVGTSGSAVSSSNKLVDNSDTSATGSGSKIPRGTSGVLDRSWIKASFGGTGADGALTITSGTTTLDLVGAKVFIKNYTSISITGTGKLAFINPASSGTIIILKSQGNVTLTSSQTPMIDASALGAAGGAAQGGGVGTSAGSAGSAATGFVLTVTGGASNRAASSPGGLVGVKPQLTADYARYYQIAPGSGGASGDKNNSNGTVVPAAGGRGGGALVIECGGALNFTTASGISVAGTNGANAANSTSTQYAVGGGAGGGGGIFLCLYNTLTSNSGSVTVSGGTGGTQVNAGIGSGNANPWGASGGGSVLNQGTTSLQGTDQASCSGAAGGDGIAIVAQNFDLV